MTFRAQLTLFFVVIVVVPMVLVAGVVFALIADNENGKADARVGAGQDTAIGLYREYTGRAAAGLRRAARDPALTSALRNRDAGAARRRVLVLRRDLGLTRLAVQTGGQTLVDVGDPTAIAPARISLVGGQNASLGRLEVSSLTAIEYLRLLKQISRLNAVVREGERSLAASLPGLTGKRLPKVGKVEVGATRYRVASFDGPGFGDRRVRVAVLADVDRTSSSISRGRVLGAVGLIAFLLIASAFAVAVSRALQAQVARLLDAARRLAAGDFSTAIPVEGHDEFAQLGEEFNKMSHQLKARLEELRHERSRVEGSIRRIGETFASNLDAEALLEIVVRTAVDDLPADCGRASVCEQDGQWYQRAAAGDLTRFQEAIREAETVALQSRRPESLVGEPNVLTVPLTRTHTPGTVLGMVTVARRGQPFSESERELFDYLARQATVSLENVGRHELARQQAVTDERTQLFNRRRFEEVIDEEVLRSKRLNQELGLLMLDIDDFKQVNDTFGHQQGDLVLREVGRVLRDSSREIDEPARYGGDELAVVLLGTDLDGSYRLAERVRKRIEALAIPRADGPGTLRVTASFGVAAMPDCADDQDDLIAAADGALYRAKRAGKNRTERASGRPHQDGLG
ncbi:MAG: diguanylate cyclase [Actinomycetota bacterium]|nr:diguanylate cyclase [Actinomycetota bacterium]